MSLKLMHLFRFDINWLKQEFQDVNNIHANKSLSTEAKTYLVSLHEKYHGKCQLAKDPSKGDMLALKQAYGQGKP